MPSDADDLMASKADEVMPSQRPPGLPFITIPGKWKLNPDFGVHQPSQSSSGFFGPPSAQNADDWSFTAATAPNIFNNAVTRGIGFGLNFVGQAIKGDVEAALEDIFGGKVGGELATQQLIATAANMDPAWKQEDERLGIDTSDPYEDARQTLPVAERMASGIGPGLLQSAPQLALTAVQPELGAVSFGFTPEGFDPVQAAAMMAAPAAGKLVGGIAGKLAAKAGIGDAQALDVINRLGGGAGVASLISAPTAYQIAQMKPGPERDEAIHDAASNAILTGLLGSVGARGTPTDLPDVEKAPRPPNLSEQAGPATATTATSEPHYAVSADGKGGLNDQAAQAGVDDYLRRQKNVPQVQIVHDPDWTHNGYGVRGTVQNGTIIVNRAFVDNISTLQNVLREEHNHSLLSSTEGRQAVRDAVKNNLGLAQLSSLAAKYPIQQGELVPDYRARLTDEFISKAASEQLPIWKQIVERVKGWLADKGIGELSDEQTARAIVRALKSGKTVDEPAHRLLDVSHNDDGDFAEEDRHANPRYNLTDEPLEGMSVKRTTEAINRLLGTSQLPASIRVVRNRTALWDVDTEGRSIVLNAARISSPEKAQQAILGESLRNSAGQPDVQKALQYVGSNLTPKEFTAEFNRRKAQGLSTNGATIRENAAIARVINSDGHDRVVRNFHTAIRVGFEKRVSVKLTATAHPQLQQATVQFLRNRSGLQSSLKTGLPVPTPAMARPLRNVVHFNGFEVRAVRSLSHLKPGTLRAMSRRGFAGRTKYGKDIVLHHLAQNPAGPLVEMPEANNNVQNRI